MSTKAEKEYMDMVAALTCLICGQPANCHHIREGQGMSQKASNWLVIPLCHEHHQGSLSIHACKRQFENLYGTELELLAETIKRIANR